MSRSAGRVWDAYRAAPQYQKDIIETLVTTLGVTGASAVLTEMSAEELAATAGLSAGASLVGRPVGRHVGSAVGRQVDRIVPEFSERGRPILHGHVDQQPVSSVMKQQAHAVIDELFPGNRGLMDSAGRYAGQMFGDNVAQIAVAAAAPTLFGLSKE